MASLFNPQAAAEKKAAQLAKKKIQLEVKGFVSDCIPPNLQDGLLIDVKEVVCGDPSCAPIDTVITLVWETGGRGIFAIPLAIDEIQPEDIQESVPDEECLTNWKAGIDSEWPPRPSLRFDVGERVECRIGPHPVKGWAPGRIIKLYYSEPNWPPNMMAPYQIALHDGRLIFAPQDVDAVIRRRPTPPPDAPESPPIDSYLNDDDDDDDDEYDDEDGDDQIGDEMDLGTGDKHYQQDDEEDDDA